MNKFVSDYVDSKLKISKLKAFWRSPPSLSSVLPYEDFFENHLLLKDGRIGSGIEVVWPYHLTEDINHLVNRERTLARFFKTYGEDFIFQFQIEKKEGQFKSCIFFKSALIQGGFSIFPKTVAHNLTGDLEKEVLRTTEMKERLSSLIVAELDGTVHDLTRQDWVNLIRSRLGCSEISENYVSLDNLISHSGHVSQDNFKVGETEFVCLIPTSIPCHLSPQVFRLLYFETIDFLISTGLALTTNQKVQEKIAERKFWLNNAIGENASRFRDEVLSFEKEFVNGEGLAQVSVAVIVKDPKILSNVQRILTQSTETEWTVERFGASKLILDSLPLNHNPPLMKNVGRTLSLPLSAVSSLIPLTSGALSYNLEKKLQYSTSEGILSGFDLRDTPGCHTAVIAGTRSGKSFLVNDMLQQYLKSEKPPIISILDKRASYETLTKYFGGKTIAFSLESLQRTDFPFHPFAGPLDDAHLEFLSSYIGLLAELSRPDSPVYATDKVIIANALKFAKDSAHASNKFVSSKAEDITLTMSEIVSALGKVKGEEARLIASRLTPYYGAGVYAKYFDRESNPSSNEAPILSFDLDGLECDKLLQCAISQAVLGQVLTRMRAASQSGKWGILLIEELGVLGDGIPSLASFIADCWKTMAKLGVVCIGVTNDIEDYLNKPAAKAVWNNSPNKLYLRMTSDQIRSLVTKSENGPAIVSGKLAELLPCLRTVASQGSDFILEAEGKLSPLKHKPSSNSYWIASSKHEDVLKIKELEKIMPIHSVIDHLSTR